ncbi:MAG: tetratricopeptide repeat protein [Dehalococcoidia bacterium]
MTTSRSDRSRASQQTLARDAIALVTEGRWQEAVELNREILERFPNDSNAYNRLGKALMELGRYSEAQAAFSRGLDTDPGNTIARKNLQRLEALAGKDCARQAVQSKVAPHHFIEETGKAGVTRLINMGEREVRIRLGAGVAVGLRIDGNKLMIDSLAGEYIGQVEQRLATRLLELVKGGNRYEGSITSSGEDGVTVILREVYQDPSQADKVSFPSKAADDFRPYVRESIKKYELGVKTAWVEDDEEEEDTVSEGVTIVDGQREALHVRDEDEDEDNT